MEQERYDFDEKEIAVFDYLYIGWQHKYIILLCVAIGLAFGVFTAPPKPPPLYQSEAKIKVRDSVSTPEIIMYSGINCSNNSITGLSVSRFEWGQLLFTLEGPTPVLLRDTLTKHIANIDISYKAAMEDLYALKLARITQKLKTDVDIETWFSLTTMELETRNKLRSPFKVVHPPTLPDKPIPVKGSKILIVSLIVSFLIGCIIAGFVNYVKTRKRDG